MRNLLYLFLVSFGSLLMMACRDNRYFLDKAEIMYRVNYDSMQYYLSQVDSASLVGDEWYDYYYYRLLSYNYLMSQERESLDSLTAVLERHFATDPVKVFRIGMMRVACWFYRMEDYNKADSLLDMMSASCRTQADSIAWYRYKYNVKFALGETDSVIGYLNEMLRLRLADSGTAYLMMGDIHAQINQPDSAIVYYQKALECDTALGMNAVHYRNRILDMALSMKDFPKAWEYLTQLRQRMKRADVPYMNLIEGDIWWEMHQPDSAMKHYRIAAETGNGYIATQAYERLGILAQTEQDQDKAFDMYRKSVRSRNELYKAAIDQMSQHDFDRLKLKNQLNELQVEQQQQTILVLGMALLVLVLVGGFSSYIVYRKRLVERNRLIQENKLLKQQEELSSLREKEARMREELFKRIKVFEKLSTSEKERRILLSDTDWSEIRVMVDSAYSDFTRKLKREFPILSDKDVNFCCLIKMNMSIQSLTDIYCISKNSVSRRKLRLKEKMGVSENETLDEFLRRFS